MWSRVYETIESPAVRLSHRSTAAAACGGFAAERPAGGIYRSIVARRACRLQQARRAAGAGAQQQMRAAPR